MQGAAGRDGAPGFPGAPGDPVRFLYCTTEVVFPHMHAHVHCVDGFFVTSQGLPGTDGTPGPPGVRGEKVR